MKAKCEKCGGEMEFPAENGIPVTASVWKLDDSFGGGYLCDVDYYKFYNKFEKHRRKYGIPNGKAYNRIKRMFSLEHGINPFMDWNAKMHELWMKKHHALFRLMCIMDKRLYRNFISK